MTQRKQIDLQAYKDAIKDFAENWPQKPLVTLGKKESIKSATLTLMLEVKLLIQKGYTVGEVVAGLKSKNLTVSEATLKTYFATAKAELKKDAAVNVDKPNKIKKTSTTKGKTTITPAVAATTESKPKKTAGAKSADKDEY